MGINIKKNDVQAQLWTIPGPLSVCCILLLIVLRSSYTPLILPIIAIGGVVACNLWKWRGVAISSGFLAAIMLYSLQAQDSQSWIWTIALSLSIASMFVVTALCSEEAYHAWERLNNDSTDHKQTLSLLNERIHIAQSKLIAEQNEFNLQIGLLQQQLIAKEEKQRSNEQLLKLARQEMTATFEKQEKLSQELFQVAKKNAALELKVVELQALASQKTDNSHDKAIIQDLQNRLTISSEEIGQLKRILRESEAKEKESIQQVESLSKEIAILTDSHAFSNLAEIEEVKKQHSVVLHDLNRQLEAASIEKQQWEKKLLNLQEELEMVALQEQENAQHVEKSQLALQAGQILFEESELKYKEQIESQRLALQSAHMTLDAFELKYKEQLENQQLALQSAQTFEENELKYKEQIESQRLALQSAHMTLDAFELKYKEQLENQQLALQSAQTFEENELRYKEQITNQQLALQSAHTALKENELRYKEQLECQQLALQSAHTALKENELRYKEQLESHQIALQSAQKISENNALRYIDLNEQLENQKLALQNAQIIFEENEFKYKTQIEMAHLAIETVEKKLEANEHDYNEQLRRFAQQSEQLEELQKEYHSAQQKLTDFIGLEQENNDLLQKLVHQKDAVIMLSAEKEALLEQLQQMTLKQQEEKETCIDNREMRRLEGLYHQLRQQFAEKSLTLSATRRELFTTQEKLLAFQKDREEAEIDDGSETIESLHRLIAAAESELALTEHQHTIEINRLHEVIESLMVHS